MITAEEADDECAEGHTVEVMRQGFGPSRRDMMLARIKQAERDAETWRPRSPQMAALRERDARVLRRMLAEFPG